MHSRFVAQISDASSLGIVPGSTPTSGRASIKSRSAIFARAAFALGLLFLLAAGVASATPIFHGTPRNDRPSLLRHNFAPTLASEI